MAFGGNVFEPEPPVEVVEEAEKRATADAALEGEIDVLEAGAWVPVEELAAGAKEQAAPEVPLRVRREDGSSARIQGGVTMEAGKKVKVGETVFKLPKELRPVGDVTGIAIATGTTTANVTIAATGAVTLSEEIGEEQTVTFDTITWSIT